MRMSGSIVGALLLVSVLAGGFSQRAVAQESPTQSCSMAFEATVGVGPNTGLALTGDLVFEIAPDGQIPQGWLIPDSGAPIPVSGQVQGRSIGLLFQVGEDQAIFGTGVAGGDLSQCDGTWDGDLGGPFAGPASGDLGDWRRKGKPGKGVIQITSDGTVIDESGDVVVDGGCIDDPAACVD